MIMCVISLSFLNVTDYIIYNPAAYGGLPYIYPGFGCLEIISW